MESKEELEQELELLKNKKRLVELKLLCFEKGTTFYDLCTDIGFKTKRLTRELITKNIGITTIAKIQETLKLDNETMGQMFFRD